MVLNGTRCVVRPWRPGDTESLVRHANDLEVAKHLRDLFPHPYTRADAHQFLAWATSADGARDNLAIQVDGEAAGGVGFKRGSDVERYSAEIGYWIGRAHWGRGIATEAVALLTAYLFDRLNVLRVFALPFADNVPSARVLQKAGFVREAVLRSGCVKYGAPRDQALFARVNENWRGEG
jgi:[ribosomal protein S5]-alanine N-acetyltransferase